MYIFFSEGGLQGTAFFPWYYLIHTVATFTNEYGKMYSPREWDPILPLIGSNVPMPPLSFNDDPGGSLVEILHSKPKNFPYNSAVDQSHYWTSFGHIGNAMHAYKKATGQIPADSRSTFHRENQVHHGSTKGEVKHESFISYEVDPVSVRYLGEDYTSKRFKDYPYLSDADGNPDFWGLTGPDRGGTKPDLESCLSALSRHFPSGKMIDFVGSVDLARMSYTEVRVDSLSYSAAADGVFILKYSLFMHTVAGFPSSWWSDGRVQVTLRISPITKLTRIPDSYINAQSSYLSMYEITIHDEMSPLDHSRGGQDRAPYFPWGVNSGDSRVEVSGFISGVYSSKPDNFQADEIAMRDALTNLDLDFQFYLDFASSSTYAASNAVNDFESVASSNYLEAISELSEIARLVPNVGPVQDFLNLVPRSAFLKAGFRLVDFAANTHLLISFGLKPFLSDIMSFSKDFDALVSKMRSQFIGRRRLYSKQRFDFPMDGPYSGFSLTTRVVMHFVFTENDIALAILPFTESGLGPTPENLWDIIPFSFVIDWFTNAGSRIELFEASLHFASTPLDYCVHSYAVEKVDPIVIPGYDFSEVTYRHYTRVVSRYFPLRLHSKFDWGGGTGVPKLLGASLLWSLLRS